MSNTELYAWWRAKRPAGWTVAEHLVRPTVNCQSLPEWSMAMYVACDVLMTARELCHD